MDVNYYVVVALIFVAALGVVLVRKFLQDGNVRRFLMAVPEITNAIFAFVKEADRRYEELLVEYADDAEEQGLDVRLLWVIDQVEGFVKTQFGIDIDINWLIAIINDVVENLKQPETVVAEPTITVQVVDDTNKG